jgi:hypothetical protein
MKLIDAFLFSEPYEKEILLIKLILGGDYISEWIIVENEYSFQGEHKGVFAQQVIESDPRFEPFRERIHIISGTLKHEALDYSSGLGALVDKQGMDSERRQRSLARQYIIDKYDDDVWVLLSDADETIDLVSDPANYALLEQKVKANQTGMVFVPRRRFWYDFDNLWNAVRSTPLVTVAQIRAATGELDMGLLRSDHIGYSDQWDRTLIFEYSYCYNRDYILRKFRTFPHGGITDSEIKQSMRCNHIPISALRSKKIDLHKDLWMEKVVLNDKNSPIFIQQNLDRLRTNVVDSSYLANRQTDYPRLYSPLYKARFAVKQFIKKTLRAVKS